MSAISDRYATTPPQQLIEEMQRRAEMLSNGEAMDLLRRQREHFFADTGCLIQALLQHIDTATPRID